MAHGFFNSKESLLLKELGSAIHDRYDVLLFDFRGHGRSAGLFYWTAKEHLDLEAVIEYAGRHYKHLGLVGFSLGAATSLIAAGRTEKIDSLIAVSCPTEFERIDYRFWELDVETDIVYNLIGNGRFGKGVRPGPFWLPKEKPVNVVSRLSVPVCYIHGEADWLIKPWHSLKLFEKTHAEKQLTMIPKGPHAEYLVRNNRTQMLGAVRRWFERTLKQD